MADRDIADVFGVSDEEMSQLLRAVASGADGGEAAGPVATLAAAARMAADIARLREEGSER